MPQNKELLQLKDYDVLGIGALRRAELETRAGDFELQLHPQLVPAPQREVYEALLAETRAWLKPQSVREEKVIGTNDEILFHLLLIDFKKNFPTTTRLLSERLAESVRSYLLEFPWQGPLLTDHFRYFAMFLKSRFQDSRLYEVAQREWLWSYLSFADFGTSMPEAGRLSVNPSLQILHVTQDLQMMNLAKGLYVFYYDANGNEVREYKMDVEDAAVVDLLQEDRKYSLDQLIDQVLMMDLPHKLAREEWQKRVYFLVARGILLESGPK